MNKYYLGTSTNLHSRTSLEKRILVSYYQKKFFKKKCKNRCCVIFIYKINIFVYRQMCLYSSLRLKHDINNTCTIFIHHKKKKCGDDTNGVIKYKSHTNRIVQLCINLIELSEYH